MEKFRERNVKKRLDKTFAPREASSGAAQRHKGRSRRNEQRNLQVPRSALKGRRILRWKLFCASAI